MERKGEIDVKADSSLWEVGEKDEIEWQSAKVVYIYSSLLPIWGTGVRIEK